MGYTSKFTGQEIDNLLTQVQEGIEIIRVMLPYSELMGAHFVTEGEFSLQAWENIKTHYEQNGYDISDLSATYDFAFKNNAEVFQKLKNNNDYQGVLVLLDQGRCCSAESEMMIKASGQDSPFEKYNVIMIQPAMLHSMFAKFTPEGATQMGSDEMMHIVLYPINPQPDETQLYSSDYTWTLNEDGSLTITRITSVSYTLYLPQDGATLTSSQKQENSRTFTNAPAVKNIQPCLVDVDGTENSYTSNFFLRSEIVRNEEFDYNTSLMVTYFDGLAYKQANMDSKNSEVPLITTIGTLNTPTAEA